MTSVRDYSFALSHLICLRENAANFLCWFLEGCDDRSSEELTLCEEVRPSSSAVERECCQLANICCLWFNHGHVKTVMYISLAVSVKQITGRTKIVTLLNRFGHAISETQLHGYETAKTEKEIARQWNGVRYIPNNIKFCYCVFG